uniref:Glycosyltransferase family 11 n=1 Tax=viral metagenome TaxID=1070528 RepID=A0A6C0JQ54_9ZZZZ
MLNTFSINYYLFYDVFLKNGDIYAIGPYYPKIQFPTQYPVLTYGNNSIRGEFIPDRDRHTMLYKFTIPNGSLVNNNITITYCHMSMSVVLEPEKTVQKHILSVSSVIKNEQDHIEQWLDYHIDRGVDHFYLYDNNSDDKDKLKEVLEPYNKRGYISLIDWSFPFKVYIPVVFPIPLDSLYFCQVVALNHCIHKYGNETRWLINMDPDEYMVPKNVNNIQTILHEFTENDICGLYLYDYVFGPNNNTEEKNTVKRFINRKANASPWLCGGKVITKPVNVTFGEVHVVTDGNNKQLIKVSPTVLSINHYHFNKDRDYRFSVNETYPVVDTKAVELITKQHVITIEGFGTWARLGNQMFQYAYLRSIAIKHNCQIKLHRLASPFGYPRAQLFDAFDIKIDVLDEMKMKKITETSMTVNEALHADNIDVNENIMFAGYFQSEKYFKSCADVIRKDFTFTEPIRFKCDPFIQNIRSTHKHVVAMHVRRSDNLDDGSPTILISDDFRDKAVEYMSNKLGEYHLIIFTDDKKWCKENLKYPNQTLSEGFSDLEDMYLMSLCDHFIIGSSSFSWWSAWLSTSKNKIIVIPDKWFKPMLAYGKPLCDQEEDLIPDTWIRLS